MAGIDAKAIAGYRTFMGTPVGTERFLDARMREIAQAERAQAYQRVVIVGVTALCMLVGVLSTGFDPERRSIAIELIAASCLCSLAFLASIRIWRGPSLIRRLLAMVHDFGALTAAMIVGGEMFLPAYAIVLWITVGNGLRYGLPYLLGATAIVLLSLALICAFTPYWRANPYVPATLVLATLLVPAYAYRLLVSLREARDAATEASLAKSRFLAHASHDLRQPIHATGLLTSCLRDTDLQPEQRRLVDDIDKSLRGVANLFRSLLDVSALDSGGVSSKVEPFAVDGMLADIVTRNAEAGRWSNVSLRHVRSSAYVACDPQLLSTIVQNIVSNAIKYAPGQAVLIGCRRKGRSLTIAVHDRGPGIEKQHLSRLFEEFYRVRTPGDRDIEGMGLGLSIVRRLADLMGLDISVRSIPGRGTSVLISGLPITDRPRSALIQNEGVDTNLSLSGLRVILVEDDHVTLAATTLTLQGWGCEVAAFSKIPEGIRSCDLLITDFDLGGGGTAVQCIDRVRQLAGRVVPAIIVTGHDAARVRAVTEQGGVTVLSKPLQMSLLRKTMRTVAQSATGSP